MEIIMVLNETMNEAAMLPQLALMPLWNDYPPNPGLEGSGRQDERFPPEVLPVLFFGDGNSEDEDMDDDEGFDDMDDDFDDDFDDDEDEDDFDEDEDYEDEDDDYDYEEDVDYDDFDE